ncbi:hypothetical protein XOCgx_2010 [Xanthomonas oryzae pv. oryzicola]|nr:hypothetical protein XocBAI21_20135 [Xanthomonas oryzae pv. oryzicola]QEO97002.1 hypothetical protein XOCgx_2010 [Xanthomonas oryzae pv. oryzicola]
MKAISTGKASVTRRSSASLCASAARPSASCASWSRITNCFCRIRNAVEMALNNETELSGRSSSMTLVISAGRRTSR